MKIISIKTIAALIAAIVSLPCLFAQDTLYVKNGEKIIGHNLKVKELEYQFTYVTTDGQKVKTRLLKILVDSITHAINAFQKSNANTEQPIIVDNNTAILNSNVASAPKNKKVKKKKEPKPEVTEEGPPKPFQYTAAVGLNIGNVLEFNNPAGTDKKSLSLTNTIDLGLNYKKDSAAFEMTNELHWLLSLQKLGLSNGSPIQRVSDDLATLHDFSLKLGKGSKWNFNLIAKFNTSVFTIHDGDYFKDVLRTNKIQGFLSPYELTLAPGIKYQPDSYFRFSLSPFSVRLYGVKNSEIANTGFFTKDPDGDGVYERFEFTRLGAELNIWYDRKVKKWLDMQYRLGFSSDYFEKIARNGLMDGLFITKIKLYKDLYLTHRATLKGDFATNILKPYYSQTVLLSFAKIF